MTQVAARYLRRIRQDPPRIEAVRLVKQYKQTRAVDDISFRIARGSITGLLGGNGAGKTTTIAMVMGLVLPTSGRSRCSAIDAARARACARPDEFRKPPCRHADAAHGAAEPHIFGRLYAVKNLAERIRQLASDLDLDDFLDRPNGKLSSGRRRAWRSPRRWSTSRSCCCSTSRPLARP